MIEQLKQYIKAEIEFCERYPNVCLVQLETYKHVLLMIESLQEKNNET